PETVKLKPVETPRVLPAPLRNTGPARVMLPPAPAVVGPGPETVALALMSVTALCRVIELTVKSGTLVADACNRPPTRVSAPVPSGPLTTLPPATVSLAVTIRLPLPRLVPPV